MKRATSEKKIGFQWTFTKQLEDLDFADDISLFSHRHQDKQEKLSRLAEEAEKTGPNINAKAPSTLIRFQTKTELVCSGYGYHPHYNAENDHRKQSHSKTLSRVERFENDAFENPVC